MPETGLPLVREVARVRDIYEGPELDSLPDLFVFWNGVQPIAAARSPSIGLVRLPYPTYRPGNHRPDGVLYAAGPGIAPGSRAPAAAVTDLAPSLAALLGESLPFSEGAAIPALCGGLAPAG